MRYFLFSLVLATTACGASFVDQRPLPADGSAPDSGDIDMMLTDSAIGDDGGADSGPGPDQGTTVGPLLSGTFVGVSGYTGAGTATLVAASDGSLTLEFSSDFATSGVPGPVVYLSDSPSLPAADELRLDDLTSTSGAQTYAVPSTKRNWGYAWVYCEPFSVEIARAELNPVP